MEIFELRYFLGVAKNENIHRASESLNVSPGSLSKAVARLEGELGVKLFKREGRNIRLTPQGRILQRRASEMIHIEESAKTELVGAVGSVHVVLVGPEILLSQFGFELTQKIKKKYPTFSFEFQACDDKSVIKRVQRGEAHLGLLTSEDSSPLVSKILSEATFHTYIGSEHKFFPLAQKNKTIPIEQVLKEAFVSPNNPLLGSVGFKQSLDGWRDDKFPRKVEYLASSLKVLERVVMQGQAIAYLPDYFAQPLGLKALKISGCPYSCEQKIRLVMRNPKEISWMNQIF